MTTGPAVAGRRRRTAGPGRAQLTLDVFAGTRIRPGVHPLAEHQHGWVVLPYTTAALGTLGDVVPAWVCCRCGGVELNSFGLENNHGCCRHWMGRNGVCSRLDARWRHQRLGLPKRRWPLDDAWLPERPR